MSIRAIAIAIAAGVGLAMLSQPARGRLRVTPQGTWIDDDAPRRIRALAAPIEREAGWPGLGDFLVATAYVESRGKVQSGPDTADNRARGWFGLRPESARIFELGLPYAAIKDEATSVALAAWYADRLRKWDDTAVTEWDAVRRGWGYPHLTDNDEVAPKLSWIEGMRAAGVAPAWGLRPAFPSSYRWIGFDRALELARKVTTVASNRWLPRQAGRAELLELAELAEKEIGLPGFAAFADAVALRESRYDNLIVNDGDARFAREGWKNQRRRKFRRNPWPEHMWTVGSGGWFGFIPTTALSAEGFRASSPELIHDPVASVVFLADFVARLETGLLQELPADERTLLAVRRYMAGLTVGRDVHEKLVLRSDRDGVPRARKVRERLARSLERCGYSADLMYLPAVVRSYPGARALYGVLRRHHDQAHV